MNFSKPKFWDKTQISFIAILLLPFSLLIKFLSLLNQFFTKTVKSEIPVICVGNIYLGGPGKTPLCIEIYSILKNLEMNPAFIRKEYSLFQDEVDLQKKIGPVYQNKKRIKAIQEAQKNNKNVAILDDGFQDFSFKKNLSIICFNEKQWIGNGLIIPAGPLREDLSALKRANCVFINGKINKNIENKMLEKNEKIKIYYSKYTPQNINEFKGKKIVAFAGIGNPNNFFDLLKDNNLNIIETIKYPDHYKYSEQELENLSNKVRNNDAILITTEKDYLRISNNYKKIIKYLKIKIEIENKNDFIEEVKKVI